MTIKQKILDGLVEDWKQAYRWFTVQAIFVLTMIATFAEAFPDEFDQIKMMLPEPVRRVVLPILGVLLILMRIKNQGSNKNG